MLQAQTAEYRSQVQDFPIIDGEGYLADPYEWSIEFTEAQAAEQGIKLDTRHWQLIDIIRDKYLRLGALPPMRLVCKAANFNRYELKQQFGSCLNLWKLAGLPNPGEEARAYMG